MRDTLERGFAVLALAYFAKAFLPFIAGLEVGEFSMQDAAAGNPVDQVVGSCIYLISLYLILTRLSHPLRPIWACPTLLAFLALAIGSAVWSSAPDVTIRRAGGLCGTALFGAYLAGRFEPREVVRLVAAAFSIALIASILLIIFVPEVGMWQDQPSGVYGHKNLLGRAMVFTALATWATCLDHRTSRPLWAIPALLLALVLVALSGSAQSVLTLVLSFAVLGPLLAVFAARFERISFRAAAFLLFGLVLGALAIAWRADEALALLGRDATLTDRTVIWDILIEFGLERPWFGRGYSAFWMSNAAVVFGERWTFLDHAHNGYMDLWLELGQAGLGFFLLLLIIAAKRSLDLYLAHQSKVLRFFPLFVVTSTMLNFVGRVFPDHNSIYWVLLCYCAIAPRAIGQTVERMNEARSIPRWAARHT
jgi:O-antigen ligase